MTDNSAKLTRILLALAMLGYALFFSIQLILHFHSFGSRAMDLGNMGQSIWNTSQGRWFHQTNQEGAVSRLSLHVEPILVPISLLYWLYPGPEILFVFQSIVVALGAIPVFALARRALHNEWLALIFALAYLLLPAMQAATLLDFHAVTLAPTFLLAAFYYLETRRPAYFALFAVLAISCKEDITLLVMMLGLYALIINRQVRLGAITLALTAAWAFVAVFVIPRTFAGTENIHWDRYGHLGSSPLNIVLNMLLQPQLFIDHLRAVEAVGYFRLLLAPTAYTALFNPVTLLLALPSLGINLLSSFPPMQEVNSLIYAAPIVPAVMISSIYGARNLRRWLTQAAARLERTPGPALDRQLIATANILLGSLIAAAALAYHAQFGYLPGGGQYRGWEEVTDHHRRAERIFSQIPPNARLSAQDRLNPHVSQRETLYIFDRLENADHILLDVTQDSWPLHPLALRLRVADFLAGDFGVVDAYDGYLLLAKERPDLPATLPAEFFDFARVANPAQFEPQYPARVTLGDQVELLGYSLSLGAHENFLPVVTLYWRALQPLADDLTLWPFFINRQGQVIETTAERPLVATLWYPPSRWQPGEIIRTSTLPLTIAPNIGDEFTLAVGVAQSDWHDPAQRLPITATEPPLPTLDNRTWARLATFRHAGRKSYPRLEPQPTAPQEPLTAEFWGNITLLGVDLPQTALSAGDSLSFGLHWQSQAPLTIDLTTFAHLVDESGNVWAQLDWQPQDEVGYLPTTAWLPHTPLIDRQTLPLPPDLPPGQYTLLVGWYYAPTGERLPLTGGAFTGDTVPAGQVNIDK